MASAAGLINGCVSSSTSSSTAWGKLRNSHKKKVAGGGGGGDWRFRVKCVSTSPVASYPYKTLSIRPGATESEVQKAFRQLPLKLTFSLDHSDVCRGTDCGFQFHHINEAYDTVMTSLRDDTSVPEMDYAGNDEQMNGMEDPDWNLSEEWMGWEGAGIRDYTSHINPYI